MRFVVLLGLCWIWALALAAQEAVPPLKPSPPVVAEALFGHERLAFQLLINKAFAPQSRLGFFSVSTFAADYRNKPSGNEYLSPVQLTYRLVKGLTVNAGATVNSEWGFRPSAGLQYTFTSPTLLALLAPGFLLAETHNFETLALLEYRPVLCEKVRFYSRLQGFYSLNRQTDAHDRSYANFRLGISQRTVSYGLGANLDRYGPLKLYKGNFGVFVRAEFN